SFRMIPFDSVGGGGALPAFMPDRVDIMLKTRSIGINKGCYVAISEDIIGGGEYEAIVNPALLA
ncbi:MAG: sigma-E processing peptidase SpoIIGA, partial [Oscillospiraceae bacterium]